MRSSAALLLASLVARALAQIPASANATALELIDAQYAASGLNLGGNAGFGIQLKSTALLTVTYGFGEVVNGQTYAVDQVSSAPDITVTPSSSSAASFNSSSKYTLMLADASSLGDPDTQGNYRHYLANNLTGVAGSSSNSSFEPVDGTAVTSYAAPGPLAGTGPHRYAFLLFEQPADFDPPANLSKAGTASGHWYVSSYVKQTGIQLVGASFFIVENGTPTGSVASTQPVNTATLAGAASSTTPSSGSKTSAASSAASGSPTGAPASGAGKLAVSVGGALAGVLGAFVLL